MICFSEDDLNCILLLLLLMLLLLDEDEDEEDEDDDGEDAAGIPQTMSVNLLNMDFSK